MSDQQPITLDLLGHGGELPARGGMRLEHHELQASLQCVGDNLHTIRVDLYHAASAERVCSKAHALTARAKRPRITQYFMIPRDGEM